MIGQPRAIDAGEGAVWVAEQSPTGADNLVEIDPHSATVVGRLAGAGGHQRHPRRRTAPCGSSAATARPDQGQRRVARSAIVTPARRAATPSGSTSRPAMSGSPTTARTTVTRVDPKGPQDRQDRRPRPPLRPARPRRRRLGRVLRRPVGGPHRPPARAASSGKPHPRRLQPGRASTSAATRRGSRASPTTASTRIDSRLQVAAREHAAAQRLEREAGALLVLRQVADAEQVEQRPHRALDRVDADRELVARSPGSRPAWRRPRRGRAGTARPARAAGPASGRRRPARPRRSASRPRAGPAPARRRPARCRRRGRRRRRAGAGGRSRARR